MAVLLLVLDKDLLVGGHGGLRFLQLFWIMIRDAAPTPEAS